MFIADFSIKHPAIIIILLVALTLFGVIAFTSMNQEMFPPITLPMATVLTTYPGAGARDVEQDITNVLENEFSTLAGISRITSTSRNSVSMISLEMQADVDVRSMVPIIRERINMVSASLPDDIDGEPAIFTADGGAFLPVYSFTVESDADLVFLSKFLKDDLSPRLARIPGVSQVNIVGEVQESVEITVQLSRLESMGISLMSVYEALRYYNVSVPAGTVEYRGQQHSIRTMGEFTNLNEIRDLVIGHKDGAYIYVKDIADVRITAIEPDIQVRKNGKNILLMDVLKRDDGNTLDIVTETERILAETEQVYGSLFQFSMISDQSESTRLSVLTVITSAGTGILLAILIIFLFLHNIRATIIIAASLPLTILFSQISMFLFGQTLNLLTLSGITVAIGMIVDGSIVVLENTHKHFRETGDRKLAASRGAGEVGSAIIASTSTSISVFLPLVFLSGLIGIIMKDLSLTIVFALLASAVVSLVVVPFLSSKLLKEEDLKHKIKLFAYLSAKIDKFLYILESIYRRIVNWALDNRIFVISLAVTVLAATVFTFTFLEITFIPMTDTAEFEIQVETPGGFSLERTMAKMDEINQIVNELVPEQTNAAYFVGTASSIGRIGRANAGFARIRLTNSDERERGIKEIIDLLQYELSSRVTDIDAIVLNGGFDSMLALATGGQGFQIEVYGNRLETVVDTANMVKYLMEQDPDVFKVETNLSENEREIVNSLSLAYMGSLGVTPYEAGLTTRILFNGMNAGRFKQRSETYDIVLQSELAVTEFSRDTMRRITLQSQGGQTISFDAFSTVEIEPTVSVINHNDRAISVSIVGYLTGVDQGAVTQRMTAKLQEAQLPYGVDWRIAGTSELIGDSMNSLIMILFISIFLVYAVMVIQFERFLQPLIIMTAVPFCLIGVVLGLLLFNSAMSIISMLGIIALAGIVVNNAIVLVDYVNLLRRSKGMTIREALVEGGSVRLVPILMTTLTTLGGVLPMAFAIGNGAEIYAPLGQAIAGGLITSTIITLILVPVLYSLIEEGQERLVENLEGLL